MAEGAGAGRDFVYSTTGDTRHLITLHVRQACCGIVTGPLPVTPAIPPVTVTRPVIYVVGRLAPPPNNTHEFTFMFYETRLL